VAGDLTYVVGEVTNNSDNVYVAVVVCASWKDGNGKVVRQGWNNGGAYVFDPGDTVPFSLPVHTPPADSTIQFYLDGIVDFVAGEVAPTAVKIHTSALQHEYQDTKLVDDVYLTTGMGEVHNRGPKHYIPEAVANVRDSRGTLLATRGDPTQCFVAAPPGGFTYMTYTVKAGVDTPPRFTLEGFQENTGLLRFPETSDLEFERNEAVNVIVVTGTLTNTTDDPLSFAQVCTGGYDRRGIVRTVANFGVELPDGGLAPGDSVPFETTMYDPGNITRVGAVADGYADTFAE
jgi:hypothetical protein